jgi:lipoprotein-anchoring transpeptidase ErfK/SrfK
MPRHSLALAFAASALSFAPAAQAAVQVTIDKSVQQMTVEVDGRPLYHWPVSTGKGSQYDTPNGKFKAFRMERDHFSKEWDDAPMPHSIFFTKQGHAIHGSYETKRLGSAASHGCVRLSPANASKLYALVAQQGVTNATVVIAGGEPSAARRSRRNSSEEAPRRPRYEGQEPAYQSYPPPPASEPRPYYAPQPDYYRY